MVARQRRARLRISTFAEVRASTRARPNAAPCARRVRLRRPTRIRSQTARRPECVATSASRGATTCAVAPPTIRPASRTTTSQRAAAAARRVHPPRSTMASWAAAERAAHSPAIRITTSARRTRPERQSVCSMRASTAAGTNASAAPIRRSQGRMRRRSVSRPRAALTSAASPVPAQARSVAPVRQPSAAWRTRCAVRTARASPAQVGQPEAAPESITLPDAGVINPTRRRQPGDVRHSTTSPGR